MLTYNVSDNRWINPTIYQKKPWK